MKSISNDAAYQLELLRSILFSRDPMRYQAAEAMVKLDEYRGNEILLLLLNDSESEYNDADIRYHICGLLHDHGDKRATEPLTKIILTDSDSDVRHIACWALGKIGDIRAIDALQWVKENDSGTDFEGRPISEQAATSLTQIRARQQGWPIK